MNKGLKTVDFELSQQQVSLINNHFKKRALDCKLEDEDTSGSVKVVLEWIPGIGRHITAYYDGEVTGAEIA